VADKSAIRPTTPSPCPSPPVGARGRLLIAVFLKAEPGGEKNILLIPLNPVNPVRGVLSGSQARVRRRIRGSNLFASFRAFRSRERRSLSPLQRLELRKTRRLAKHGRHKDRTGRPRANNLRRASGRRVGHSADRPLSPGGGEGKVTDSSFPKGGAWGRDKILLIPSNPVNPVQGVLPYRAGPTSNTRSAQQLRHA
jgi:hypothetical protein